MSTALIDANAFITDRQYSGMAKISTNRSCSFIASKCAILYQWLLWI